MAYEDLSEKHVGWMLGALYSLSNQSTKRFRNRVKGLINLVKNKPASPPNEEETTIGNLDESWYEENRLDREV